MTQQWGFESATEHWLVGDAPCSGIEACGQLFERLFPPPWNEARAHRHQFDGATGDRPHHIDRISRRNVVVRLQIASKAVRESVQVPHFVPRIVLDEWPRTCRCRSLS